MVVFLALLGLIIGSFLNVLIYRLNVPKAPKWWQGRSVCPHCQKKLLWQDNIPLVSFVALGRRCRHCKNLISWQYPLVELTTAIFFAVTGWNPVIWALESVFIVIFFSDWIYGLIPDEMILVGSFAALIYNLQFTIYNQFLISNFKFQIENLAREKITSEMLERVLRVDCELKLEKIDMDLYNSLARFAPFGIGNPEPVFASTVTIQSLRTVGQEGKHLKLVVDHFDAIAFNRGNLIGKLKAGDKIKIAYNLDLNSFNGTQNLQLKVKDIIFQNLQD